MGIAEFIQPISLQHFFNAGELLGGQFFSDLKAENNISINCPPFQKMILLEHISDAGISGKRRRTVHKNRTFFCWKKTADQVQKRGFSTAGRTDNSQKFARQQMKGYM